MERLQRGETDLHLVKAIDGDRFLIGNNRGGTNGLDLERRDLRKARPRRELSMRVLVVEAEPLDELPAWNAAGRGEIEEIRVPILRANVDSLPEPLEAIVAAADLQALEPPNGATPPRLLGEALAERLLELGARGEIPAPERTGVLLAGDLYTVPDLSRRGGSGDVRSVWLAFAKRFRWWAEIEFGGPAVADGTVFEMVFENGNRHRFAWNGNELLSKRVGRTVSNLFAGPTSPFYFHTAKQLTLCFYVLTVRSTGQRLLYWHEDD